MCVEEIGKDAGDQRLERGVEPGLLGVKLRVALDQPAGIADRQTAQHHLACTNRHHPLPPDIVLEV
jgi:hypothetical protein